MLVEERRHHKAATWAKSLDEASDERRRNEAAARAAESEALALVKECRQNEAATRAALSTVSSLADERPCHEVVSPNHFDAARGCIQVTCKLITAPLDAILADIEREDIEEGARTTPLVGAPSLP